MSTEDTKPMTRNDATHDDAQDEHKHFTPDGKQSTVTDAWEGAFIYTSWGYNQTTVDYAQIVEVSDTGKTVKARRCKSQRQSAGQGSENVSPVAERFGDEFRLHVREFNGEPSFRGSYPYIDGDLDQGSRKGSFRPYAKGDKGLHQTAPGYGH